MAKSEKLVQKEIIIALNQGKSRAFRNNVGSAKTEDGRYISFGLMKGSGDLIGWESITITPDMVGQEFARFLSVEVKAEKGGKVSEAQQKWCDRVNQAGGRAVITNTSEGIKGSS